MSKRKASIGEVMEDILKKSGRKKIGEPISITLTPEQRAWIDARIKAGGTRTQVVRDLIDAAMREG